MALSYIAASATPTLVAVAKTRVFIGTTATSPTADTFTEVGGVLEIPSFGPSETPIKVQTVGQDLEVTLKGVTTLGGGTLKCVDDIADAGQLALAAAQQVKTGNYNLRIIFPNGPTGNPTDPSVSHGTIKDIKVVVLGAQEILGGPNNPIHREFVLGFNSLPTTTAAV